jgi:mitotic-spindle organizing protein 1
MHEISRLLDTGLDRETLAVLAELVESGVHPEALALAVRELRRESAELRAAQQQPEQQRVQLLEPEASEGEPSQAGTV